VQKNVPGSGQELVCAGITDQPKNKKPGLTPYLFFVVKGNHAIVFEKHNIEQSFHQGSFSHFAADEGRFAWD